MLKFFAVTTYICGVISTLILLAAFGDDSAPRAAAKAGMAIALVVIPYCMARIFWMNAQRGHQEDMRKFAFRINTLLENSSIVNAEDRKS